MFIFFKNVQTSKWKLEIKYVMLFLFRDQTNLLKDLKHLQELKLDAIAKITIF